MLTEEEFYKESIDENLYYLRTLRDFCINIELSFYGDNPYKDRAATIAKKSQDLGREIVTFTNGKVPNKGVNYQIYYTQYTTQVLESLEQGSMLLEPGDNILVSVKNQNSTAAQSLNASFLGITNSDTYAISAEGAGMIYVKGTE